MTLYAPGTFTANYEAILGDQPDIISLHEFGVETDHPGPVMLRLAETAIDLQDAAAARIDIVGTVAAHTALQMVSGGNIGIRDEHLLKGDSSNAVGVGLGTKGEIANLKRIMDDEGLELPILLGQAYHIGRIALQAQKAEIHEYLVPEGLPSIFSPKSIQPWTRNKWFWGFREVVGVPLLHLTNKF